MSEYIFFCSGEAISWLYVRQERTAWGSSEAEIKATNKLAKKMLVLKNVMQDLSLADTYKCTKLWKDNCNCVD